MKEKKDKSEIILDVVVIFLMVIIIAVCIWMAKAMIDSDQKVYVQKWASPETGVCYYITDYGICPLYNQDGTLYVEKK